MTWFQFGGNFLGSLYLDTARAERDLPRCGLAIRSWAFGGTQPSCRVPWHPGNRSLLERLRGPWSRGGKEALDLLWAQRPAARLRLSHVYQGGTRNSGFWKPGWFEETPWEWKEDGVWMSRLLQSPLGRSPCEFISIEPSGSLETSRLPDHRLWGLQICGRTKNALANLWTRTFIN